LEYAVRFSPAPCQPGEHGRFSGKQLRKDAAVAAVTLAARRSVADRRGGAAFSWPCPRASSWRMFGGCACVRARVCSRHCARWRRVASRRACALQWPVRRWPGGRGAPGARPHRMSMSTVRAARRREREPVWRATVECAVTRLSWTRSLTRFVCDCGRPLTIFNITRTSRDLATRNDRLVHGRGRGATPICERDMTREVPSTSKPRRTHESILRRSGMTERSA
jgi:hypothetical protein